MLTVFPTLVRRPTLSKMDTRGLKTPWSQAGSDETTIPSLALKTADWCRPSPLVSPFSSASSTIPSILCQTTVSTTTLKMVGDSGSPYVTPLAPLNALP